jgi:hypothetical protein
MDALMELETRRETASPGHAADLSLPTREDEPQLAPAAELAADAEPPIALLLATPPSAPLAIPVAQSQNDMLLERILKLEEALASVQNLQGIEQRVAERVATQLQIERPTVRPETSPVISRAAALLDAGKHLLPSLIRTDTAPGPAPPHNAPAAAQRSWLLWETIAEARVIIRMYVDPRYTLSWLGRTVPLVLLPAFLLTYYWVPFASISMVGWILEKSVQLVVGFVLFKVLGHEARRYRETAPDLPPSLRL